MLAFQAVIPQKTLHSIPLIFRSLCFSSKKVQISGDFEPFGIYRISLGGSGKKVAGYLIDIKTFASWFKQTTGYSLTPNNLTPTDVREYRQFLLNVQKAKASNHIQTGSETWPL